MSTLHKLRQRWKILIRLYLNDKLSKFCITSTETLQDENLYLRAITKFNEIGAQEEQCGRPFTLFMK